MTGGRSAARRPAGARAPGGAGFRSAGRRIGRSLLAAFLVAEAAGGHGLAGCGGAPPRPRAVSGLSLVVDVPEALVFVDEEFAGRAADVRKRPLPLTPGFHRVEVRSPDHFTGFAEVTLAPGVAQRLEVRLRRLPPGATP